MTNSKKINSLVLTALMIALVTIGTLIIRIPSPTQGYVNLGDGMVFMSILLLGKKNGTIAAAVGSSLGDVVGGYPMWAPWTFFIKGIMALVLALLIERILADKNTKFKIFGIPLLEILAMTASGLIMVIGYYIAKAIMVNNWIVPMLGVPGNIFQFSIGIAIAILVSNALYKTSSKTLFKYRFDLVK
jgi:uncharacterized membrane protein